MEINKNIKDIIRLYSLCTGNADKKNIVRILEKSSVYKAIAKGDDECYNYEGYIANLFEIVADIKAQGDYPLELDKITPDVVAAVNRAEIDGIIQRKQLVKNIIKEANKIAVL
ncbi:MAG: hypothetical protein IJ695_06415 [Butyrivibrio sp.]|nr:hypothetical protein [Butyrivibrio sp.]